MQGKVIKNIVKIIATAMLVCVMFACLTGCLYDDPKWYTTEQHINRISKLVQRHYMKDGDYTSFTVQPLYAADGETVVMYLVEFKPHGFYFVSYDHCYKNITLIFKMYMRDIEKAPSSKKREWSRYRLSEEQPENYGDSVWIQKQGDGSVSNYMTKWYESDGENAIKYVDSPYTVAEINSKEKKFLLRLKDSNGEDTYSYIPAIKVGDEYLNLISMRMFKYNGNITQSNIENFYITFIASTSFNL